MRVEADTRTEHQSLSVRLEHPDSGELRIHSSLDRFGTLAHGDITSFRPNEGGADFRVHAVEAGAHRQGCRLFFELLRLLPRPHKQFLRGDTVREHLKAHRNHWQQFFQERDLSAAECAEGPELDDSHQVVIGHQWITNRLYRGSST